MASYPTAVKVFTTKNAGDTIQAADVDDLQDEVNAIEAGLLNGTAPLNAAASTLASLSVTGGSTFAGAVTITGTFTAPALALPYVRVTQSAKTDVASATWTGISFDTEVIDASNLHSTSVNSSRITLGSSGSWLVGGSVAFAPNSSATRQIRILVNDTNAAAYLGINALPAAGNTPVAIATQVYATSSNDYVTLVVFQDSGSTGSIVAHSGGVPCTFWAQRVSA